MSPAPLLRIRVVRPGSVTYRVGVLTPYFAQTIAGDARRGGRIDVEVTGDADDDALVDVHDAFARLRIPRLRVTRDGGRPGRAALLRAAAGGRAGGAASASVATGSSRRRVVQGRASRARRPRPS